MNKPESEINHRKVKVYTADELTLIEVTDHELELLVSGSASTSISLNFSIFMLSTSISIFIALLTTNIETEFTILTFISADIITFVLGIFFAIKWHIDLKNVNNILKRIKRRMEI